jgi:hypothetical protein
LTAPGRDGASFFTTLKFVIVLFMLRLCSRGF